MKVARAYSIRDVRLEEQAVPTIGPGDALLKVEACGLCTSDCLDWYVASKAPIVLGHEPTGTIVEVGADVRDFRVGDRVFAHHHVPCGECAACRRGADTSCQQFKRTNLDPGGFAEYLRIPAANLGRDTLVLPDTMDWETGTWIEPLACSLRTFQRVSPPDSRSVVLVIGLGSMGLLNGILARVKGAGTVIGSDPVEFRRRTATALGFDGAFDPLAGSARESLNDLARADGADLVIVGPGSQAAIEQGLACVAPGGTVVLFTPTPAGWSMPIVPHTLYFSEITVTASYSCGPGQTREALELLAARRLDPTPLVSARVGLEGVGDAIARTVAKGNDLKAVVYPGR